MIYDIIIDTLFEDQIEIALKTLGGGRLVMDKEDPEEPYTTQEEGYLIVRVKDRDPVTFARELERRAWNMRIVKIVNRTPGESDGSPAEPSPGSFAAQRANGLL